MHVATRADVLEAVETARRARQEMPGVLRALMRFYDLHDEAVGDAFGVSRQAMNNRLNGKTAIQPHEDAGFAAYFGVPVGLLYRSRDEALRWLLDHPEEVAATRARLSDATVGLLSSLSFVAA